MGGGGELGGFQMIWLAGKLLIGKRGGPAPFLHVWPQAPVGLGARKQPELAYGVDVLKGTSLYLWRFPVSSYKDGDFFRDSVF